MKKCTRCGAVQNDDRTSCIDCGALLGRSMTREEENLVEAELDDRLDGLAERTEDFYVPLRDKILGVLCIIGAVAAILLLNFVRIENKEIKGSIPDGVMISQGGVTVIMSTDGSYSFPTGRVGTLNDAGVCAVVSLVAFIGAVPMLLIPQLMWKLDTLKYRIFYNWETTPSSFALVMRKALTYGLCGIGTVSIFYGYFQYFLYL